MAAELDQRRRAESTTFFDLNVENGLLCARLRPSVYPERSFAEPFTFRVKFTGSPLILEEKLIFRFTNTVMAEVFILRSAEIYLLK